MLCVSPRLCPSSCTSRCGLVVYPFTCIPVSGGRFAIPPYFRQVCVRVTTMVYFLWGALFNIFWKLHRFFGVAFSILYVLNFVL